ncbi:hypothetical protein [Microbacterium sp. p3-SID336]|uniref:hypothetical protein n=1 Tax=Microbacterium sp. p3-SID336 TaxID=2916212 RepID=UPI0021A898CF|nr:hypothetical protein [Microbacterium sp. p3-SID336]MCT1479365.1 hypothetical protein [Microbacterium sp. p3-SID336]
MSAFTHQSGVTERMLAMTEKSLRASLMESRLSPDRMATIALPSTSIDGLLGMLGDPSDSEFWYRRRQFIMFFAMTREAQEQV